jgi:hypothetical protein
MGDIPSFNTKAQREDTKTTKGSQLSKKPRRPLGFYPSWLSFVIFVSSLCAFVLKSVFPSHASAITTEYPRFSITEQSPNVWKIIGTTAVGILVTM